MLNSSAPESPAGTPCEQTIPFSRRRQAIARRLTLSAQTIPHFYLSLDVDMASAAAWRRTLNDERCLHITVTDLVAKVTALALRQFPRLNAHVGDDSITLKPNINLGIAVAADEGLLVPVIPNADRLGLVELSECSGRNSAAARKGRMTSAAIGTFTVSSLGMYGVKHFLPIINPPECAILAVGLAEPRVVPVLEGVAVRPVMTLTLACDHRAVDGAEAAQFLSAVKEGLEDAPSFLSEWAPRA